MSEVETWNSLIDPNFPNPDMVHPIHMGEPSLPPFNWQIPFAVKGVIPSIHHKSSAHCGRISVHWTVQNRVPSRLSVRGGVQLLIPPNTSSERDAARWKKTGKEWRGGKTAPEEESNTGKEKRGWMDGERRRKTMRKGPEWNRFAFLLCFLPPLLLYLDSLPE